MCVWVKGQRKARVFIVRDITQAWLRKGKWLSWRGVEEQSHGWDEQTFVTLHKKKKKIEKHSYVKNIVITTFENYFTGLGVL